MAQGVFFGPGDPNVPGGGGLTQGGGSLGLAGAGFAPGPGLGQGGGVQDPAAPGIPPWPGVGINIGGIWIPIGGGGGSTTTSGSQPGTKPKQSTIGLTLSPSSGGSGGGGQGAIGQVTRGGPSAQATLGGNAPPTMLDPLNYTPQPAVNFPQPRPTPQTFFLGNFQRGGVIPYFMRRPNVSPMPFAGSFQGGGIVPATGLYPVRGGEQVIPRKKVQKIAKLHKGELVLPRYVGSFQDGTDSVPSDGTPMTPEQIRQQQINAQQAADRAAARAAGKPIDQPTILPGTQTSGTPMSENPPVNIPGVSRPSFNPVSIIEKLLGRRQQAAGGAASQAGAVVSPARPGQLIGAPQPPQYGAEAQRATLPTGGILPGTPPAVGVAGGPASYYVPPQQVPFQSQFVNKAARNQYITANITGQLSNALMMWRQKKYDEQVNKSKNITSRDLQNEYLKQQAANAAQQQQPAQQQPAPPPQQGLTGAMPALQQQAQNLGGAPGSMPQGGMPQPQGTRGGGAPGQPGQQPGQQQADPTAGWSANDRHAYQVLANDPNPKTQKLAQQFLKAKQQEEVERAKIYAAAEKNPFGAEGTGRMQAYQEFQNQLNAQAELETKQAQAKAQTAYAQAAQIKADVDRQVAQNQLEMQHMMFGIPDQSAQSTPAQQTTPSEPAKTGDLLGKMRGPFQDVYQKLGGDKLKPEYKGTLEAGVIASMSSGTFTPFYEAASKVQSALAQDQPRVTTTEGYAHVGPGMMEPTTTTRTTVRGPADTTDQPPAEAPPNQPVSPFQAFTPPAPAGAQAGATPQPARAVQAPTTAAPAGRPSAGIPKAPRQPIFGNIPINAYNPKDGRWYRTSPKEATEKGYTQWSGQVSSTRDDIEKAMNGRLADAAGKLNRYESQFDLPISEKDRGDIARTLSSPSLRVGGMGIELSLGGLNSILDAENIRDMSDNAKKRVIGWYNARDALLGYTTVVAGGARYGYQAVEINIGALPNPMFPEDFAKESMRQFKANIPYMAKALPIIPGTPDPMKVLTTAPYQPGEKVWVNKTTKQRAISRDGQLVDLETLLPLAETK